MQHRKPAVLGAKVMAPLAHAMRFVNRKQTQAPLRMQHVELCQKTRRGQTLRGGIQERGLATAQALLHRIGFFARQTGIQKVCLHTGFVQCAHLVMHEGNQWRDHHRHAVSCALTRNGRHLVTQRFTAARGHQHQGVTTATDMLNNVLLRTSESVVTKHLAQDVARVGVHHIGYICSHGNPSKRQPFTLER